jgi:OPA family sugar phosphate sensor protein UhpC-like MFS transporter
MIKNIINFFKAGPTSQNKVTDAKKIRKEHSRHMWMTIIGTTIGYGLFYVARLSMSVVKKPMLDEGFLTTTELGIVGSALFFAYAFGKFTNGFLADRANVKRFMAFGLLISALLNLALGFTSAFWLFVVLWGANGWFQSMGAAPAVASLTNWVPKKRMGTVYGWFSISHNIGEGLSFVCTALLVGAFGWRWGFVGAAAAAAAGSIFLYFMLSDKPEAYGLPAVDSDINEPAEEQAEASSDSKENTGQQQLAVLKNPLVWLVGISSAMMYVSRYAVNSWAILFFQEQKGYDLLDASGVMSIYAAIGIFGSISSGWISDTLFNSKRGPVTIFYGLLQVMGMCLVFYSPDNCFWADKLGMGIFGFATGGLLVLLGGLIAVDIAGKQAAGAAMGVIGIFSYIGAGCQEWLSGSLITSSVMMIDGAEKNVYDFSTAITFWVGASITSMLLAMLYFYLQSRKNKPLSEEDIDQSLCNELA